eukprot:11212530-Lingulodinium_polyedra.AAC.1
MPAEHRPQWPRAGLAPAPFSEVRPWEGGWLQPGSYMIEEFFARSLKRLSGEQCAAVEAFARTAAAWE